MLNDKELVHQAKEGDESAFGQILNRYSGQVRKTVFSMIGDHGVSEDIAQEVFIRFYRSLNQFRGESSLGTYLTRIAINLSLNEIQRNKNDRERQQKWSEEQPVFSTEDGKKIEINEMIEKALQLIEPDFRQVVVLRLIDGYSVKETADILEIPIGTVASRLARAQTKLKAILMKWDL